MGALSAVPASATKTASPSLFYRPWYHYLVAATSVAALAAQNVGRGVSGSMIALVLVFSLSLAGVSWILAGMLVRDPARRGLLALLGVILAVWYGSVRAAAGAITRLLVLESSAFATAAVIAGMSIVGFWIIRTRRDLSGSVRFLNVALLASLLMACLPLLRGGVAAGGATAEAAPVQRGEPVVAAADDPDIFLIILDAYAGPSSLRANYGLDISDFTAALKAQGFVVPNAARANYTATFLSLAAMLDWRYLDEVAAAAGPESQDRSLAYTLLHDNSTLRFLRSRGYRYVFFRSPYPPLNDTPSADLLIPDRLASEFEQVWLRGTVLDPALRLGISLSCRFRACEARSWPFQPDAAVAHERRFQQLAQVPEGDRPTFVFAHVLLPHEPFLFDARCQHVAPYWPDSSEELASPATRRAYAAQVQCLNSKVLALVERLATRRRPTVILLQGDHGYGRMPQGRPIPLDSATHEQVAERLDVFAAYRLPNAGAEVVYDSISPVNVLPRIFGHYFGLHRPTLPDQSYWSSWAAPFQFKRVH